MPRKTQKVVLLWSSAAIISSNFFADSPSQALESKSAVETLVALFSKWSGSSTDRHILQEAARYIDYAYMSREALGHENWDKLTEAERRQFERAFQALVEKRYYPRWHRVFSKSKITYGKELVENGLARLKTEIAVGDDREEIDWDLIVRGSEAKVVNLTVDGKDLIRRLGRRLQKRLSKSGFPAFMTWIRSRNLKSSDSDR